MNNSYPNKSSMRHLVFLLLAGCLLCGLLQRWTGLERTPEYDELYTLNFFAAQEYGKIFLDVATPNNHTLNSWTIKFLYPFLQGRTVLALRLGAFLSGIGLLLLSLYMYCRIPPFKKSLAGGIFLAFIAFNGALLHYASTGRGYSCQSLFVLGAALSLLYLLKRRISIFESFAFGVLFLLCGLGAILSVSTGILFLTGLGLGALFLLLLQYKNGKEDWKNFLLKRKTLWIVGILFGILSLAYYLPLAGEFMKGSSFGGRLNFSWNTLKNIKTLIQENDLVIPFVFILLALLFSRKNWKIMVFFLIAGAFPYLSGFIFRAGPPRVYVPSLPLILAAGALAGAEVMGKWKKKNLLMGIVPILLALSFFYTSPKVLEKSRRDDLGVTYSFIREKVPRNFYPVFMPTESFALEMLYGEEPLKELHSRMENIQGIMLAGKGIGATLLKNGSTDVFPVPEGITPLQSFTAGGKQLWNLYGLTGLSREPKEYDFIFILGKDTHPGELYPLTGKEFLVNFRQNRLTKGGEKRFLFLIPGKDLPYPLTLLRQWEREKNGRLQFLVLQEK